MEVPLQFFFYIINEKYLVYNYEILYFAFNKLKWYLLTCTMDKIIIKQVL